MSKAKHKHAEMMRLYAEDAMMSREPWKKWEFKWETGDKWGDLNGNPIWCTGAEYRRKKIKTEPMLNGIYNFKIKPYQEAKQRIFIKMSFENAVSLSEVLFANLLRSDDRPTTVTLDIYGDLSIDEELS